jgi:hypothetical protein
MATALAVAFVVFSCKGNLSEAEKLDLSMTPLQVVDSMFFIQTENKAGPAFFGLKKAWNAACDEVQGTPPFNPGN